jgi:hypothetical protein
MATDSPAASAARINNPKEGRRVEKFIENFQGEVLNLSEDFASHPKFNTFTSKSSLMSWTER